MSQKALTDEEGSEGDVLCAPKLLEVILQNCRGRVDQCIPLFISLALSRSVVWHNTSYLVVQKAAFAEELIHSDCIHRWTHIFMFDLLQLGRTTYTGNHLHDHMTVRVCSTSESASVLMQIVHSKEQQSEGSIGDFGGQRHLLQLGPGTSGSVATRPLGEVSLYLVSGM